MISSEEPTRPCSLAANRRFASSTIGIRCRLLVFRAARPAADRHLAVVRNMVFSSSRAALRYSVAKSGFLRSRRPKLPRPPRPLVSSVRA